ncbi:hypothetical protein A4A49_03239 [Nicotiana attenuata]|uniref:Uncharacterized protein n=1 Tax=Nicotiana attenuata TaxID=49451 RepID=A0A314L2D6_NICAT|nr:hypothetical protein A4A49_03239 [Nicotiana attenuata]
MAGNGSPRTHPEYTNDGRVCPDGNNYPKSKVPSSTGHTAPSPGSGKLWTPVIDVHLTPRPVHGEPTTPIYGGTQHAHGTALPDHALLPPHEPRDSSPISNLPTLPTNSSSSSTTIPTTLTHRTAEHGNHHCIGLPQGVQCGPGKHVRKTRDAKDKGLPHAGTPGDRVQEQSGEMLIALCPQKTHKLQTRSPSALISKLKKTQQ